MNVQVGTTNAIEGTRKDPSGEGEVTYSDLSGERITVLSVPDSVPLMEAFSATVSALTHHIHRDHTPVWVDSDSEGMRSLLLENYGLDAKAGSRPKGFGKDTGADKIPFIGQTTEDSK